MLKLLIWLNTGHKNIIITEQWVHQQFQSVENCIYFGYRCSFLRVVILAHYDFPSYIISLCIQMDNLFVFTIIEINEWTYQPNIFYTKDDSWLLSCTLGILLMTRLHSFWLCYDFCYIFCLLLHILFKFKKTFCCFILHFKRLRSAYSKGFCLHVSAAIWHN